MVLTSQFNVKGEKPSVGLLSDKDSAQLVIASHIKTMRKSSQVSEINMNSSDFKFYKWNV